MAPSLVGGVFGKNYNFFLLVDSGEMPFGQKLNTTQTSISKNLENRRSSLVLIDYADFSSTHQKDLKISYRLDLDAIRSPSKVG